MTTVAIRRPWTAAIVMLLGMLSVPSLGHAAKPKMLLQDLQPQGVTEPEAAVLTTSTCMALAKQGRHDVLCGDDLRTMMRFGAMSSTFRACEGDACFSQIGKALKARFVISGSVSKLGDTFVLSLSAFDTKRTRAVGRAEVKAPTIEQLQLQVDEAVSALLPRAKQGA